MTQLQTKSRRAHECAAGQPVDRDRAQIGFALRRVKASEVVKVGTATRARESQDLAITRNAAEFPPHRIGGT